ncbi:sulfatase [Labilibaculum sp.]|uniref:sulfatase n=1 Tax=Labilibaculum sp. TaxID=2060723 RepID=UPI0035623E75
MMKKNYPIGFILLLLLSVSCLSVSGSKVKKTAKPNIVFILVDDLGWKDVGFMGSSYYETPNIDVLASESMVFTSAYAGAANCAPSRACLISGTNATRTGVYTVSPSDRGKTQTRKIIPIKNTEFLADSVYTLAEMMKDAGYVTGHFGKWHVGEDPLTQGFDVNVGGGRQGHPKNYFAPYVIPNIEAPEGECLTDRLTNEALSFIETNQKKPFFLYLPYYAVHTPLQGKEALIEKYKRKEGTVGQNNPAYAAMIEGVDSNVGLILDKLKQLNLDKNTLVVFTSDNGGVYGVSRQNPLRAGKGSYYEGGIRVPLAIKWPDHIKSGKTDTPVTNLDFYPTFMELVGENQCNPESLDGESLVGLLLRNESIQERAIYYHFPVYIQGNKKSARETRDPLFRTRPGTLVRKGNWKLHFYYEDQSMELYNLAEDLGEKNNLADKNPQKRDELKGLMDAWLIETNAPIPEEINLDYDPEFEREKMREYVPANKAKALK